MENRRKSKRGAANESNEDEEMAKSRKKHKEVFIYVMKELLTKASKKFLKFFRIRPAIQFKYDSKNKENKGTKQQKQDKDSSYIPLPPEWDPQPQGKVVHLVSLSKSSEEYQKVLNHFTSKGGKCNEICKIERIQNPALYKQYLVKKQSMNGEENEMQLFHGTNAKNTPPINANNFNRSFAGINGVKYGNGVYFAREASYSLRYSQAQGKGPYQMYVAKVLVGTFTAGRQTMKTPPLKKDPNNPQMLYDSVVDNIQNPTIFVIFLDHQCYPEYLITYM